MQCWVLCVVLVLVLVGFSHQQGLDCDSSSGVDTEPVSNEPEPKGGKICHETAFVQEIYYRCEPRYCCEIPCDCNSTRLTERDCGPRSIRLRCSVQQHTFRPYKKVCCKNFTENAKKICVDPSELNDTTTASPNTTESDTSTSATTTSATTEHPTTTSSDDGRTTSGAVAGVVGQSTMTKEGSGVLSLPLMIVLPLIALVLLLFLCLLLLLIRRRKNKKANGSQDGTAAFENVTYDIRNGTVAPELPPPRRAQPLGAEGKTNLGYVIDPELKKVPLPDEEFGAVGGTDDYDDVELKKKGFPPNIYDDQVAVFPGSPPPYTEKDHYTGVPEKGGQGQDTNMAPHPAQCDNMENELMEEHLYYEIGDRNSLGISKI